MQIENVVASSDVKFPIHLDELQLAYYSVLDRMDNESPKEDKVQY